MTTKLAPAQIFLDGKVELRPGDCRDVIRAMPDDSIDSVVTDPPYALVSIQKRFGKEGSAPTRDGDVYSRSSAGFMGKQWDTGETAFAVEFWAEVFRVLKPGGHVVAFSGTRTYHRMTVAIEDAGFEIRDQLAWVYGSGFPKSHDVSKAIDKHFGAEREKVRVDASKLGNPPNLVGGAIKGDDRPWRLEALERGYHEKAGDEAATPQAAEWQGWGTALKPAWEPICLARKPLIGTVAANVLEHGTGALNIDGCRVGDEERFNPSASSNDIYGQFKGDESGGRATTGRWPANIAHDGSDEVLAGFPDSKAGTETTARGTGGIWSDVSNSPCGPQYGDSGSAARFFYTAKADKLDRIGSKHPTVKPVVLMQWLVRLVTPKGGLVLDPFAGSGSTGEAAWREGMRCILIEREEEYQSDIAERLRLADKGPATRRAKAIKQVANDNLPLFSTGAA
ncbi:DNA-methyltransferase [Mesorhizobium retamae]|uniref:Methyltransferase n=1 Tax=Mesorhizobium retamae TaxID=2912854 RepID=A0ABS9QI01_9HYPH|nr:DNA methyltransferase [Mesorhizobium sp. IRAMC:0171]MCG7507082.1 site-specific DNA-methyltransferase [Mesorhizobium sp. IRAMC:0171]